MKKHVLHILLCIITGIIAPAITLGEATDFPSISSTSTNSISVTSKQAYEATIAIYGENFGYLLNEDVYVQIGPLQSSSVSGNAEAMNVTFPINYAEITNRKRSYPVEIILENESGEEVIAQSSHTVRIFNPYQGKYRKRKTRRFLKRTPHKRRPNKRTVGLNVHWALGSDTTLDDSYEYKLRSTNTKWAREHISYKLIMGDDSDAWLKRYDEIMLKYDEQDIRVVGMLAYGSADDEFSPPSKKEWKNFVRKVVRRYRNYVDAWEIWNEPDSSTYLSNNNWKTYKPLLRTGSQMIREYDSSAIILNGAIADIANTSYINRLYRYGDNYFDELNVHVYYCDRYRDGDTSLTSLQSDWEQLIDVTEKYRKNEKIWITELGCSTGLSGADDKLVRNYLKKSTQTLLKYKETRPIFLYTFRDRPYLDSYEAEFGLLEEDLSNKPAWRWYKQLRVR